MTIGFLSLLLFAGAAYYAYWSLVLHRFTTFSSGEVYQSAQMPPDELLRVADQYGIRSVIDLREITEVPGAVAEEARGLSGSGVTYKHLPTGHVPTDETVDSFLSFVANPANRPVLIHCRHGTGRSVLFATLYRLEFEGWDNETARRDIEPLHWQGNFGPDSPKGEYLLSYRPRGTQLAVNAGD